MSVEMGSGALNSAALMAILIPHMEKRFSADLDQHPSHEASQRRDRVLALPGPVLAVPGPVLNQLFRSFERFTAREKNG